MADEVKPDVIKKTQEILGKFIKKPTLTEKLLKKPPFRFLHDICTSVMKETGFFGNVLTPDDNVENIKDKEGKIEFLQKVITAVEVSSGIKLTVKPTKIVAGLEPTKTNEFLQALGKAIENQQGESKSTKTAPTKTKVSKKPGKEVKEEPPDKKKTSKSKKIIENGVTEVNKIGVEPPTSPRKKHSSKKSNQTPREDEKSHKKAKSEAEEIQKETKSVHGAGESKDLPDVGNIKMNGLAGEGDQNTMTKEEVTDVPQKRPSGKHKHRKPSIHNVPEESERQEVVENNENLKPNAEPVNGPSVNEKVLQNKSESPLKEQNTTPSPSSQFNYSKKEQSLVREGTLISRPRTGIRAPTARPASARPAAPRIRDRGEIAVTEEVMKPASGKVQVIVDDETTNEEDENLISLETTTDILLEEPTPTMSQNEPNKEQEHGHLVEQILEVQRELEDHAKFSEQKTSSKTEIEWESGRNRESTNREIENLRITIQNLTRTANPLGKLLDFFQEDIEIVQKELESWKEKNISYCSQIAQEKSITDQQVEPLKIHLKELQHNIDEQLDQISAVKANIIRNNDKIHKLLSGL